jgi:hypothetical protein
MKISVSSIPFEATRREFKTEIEVPARFMLMGDNQRKETRSAIFGQAIMTAGISKWGSDDLPLYPWISGLRLGL